MGGVMFVLTVMHVCILHYLTAEIIPTFSSSYSQSIPPALPIIPPITIPSHKLTTHPAIPPTPTLQRPVLAPQPSNTPPVRLPAAV